MGRVWVVGSANLDMVFRTPRFPAPGETLLGGPFQSFPGGKGANQAVAIGQLEGEVSFVGCLGSDAFGEVLEESLQTAGVDTTYVCFSETASSGTAAILIDESGQNEIIVAPGANMELPVEHVRESLVVVGADEPVLVQLEIPVECVEAAAEFGRLFLNPAPARALPDSLLAKTFAITPNESETELVSGIRPSSPETCRSAARILLDRGVRNVVITLGENGCYWTDGTSELTLEAPKVKAVDTVAAGDAFNGALAWFIAEGREWKEALNLANHAAALSVTRHGAQASMSTLEELRAFAPHLF